MVAGQPWSQGSGHIQLTQPTWCVGATHHHPLEHRAAPSLCVGIAGEKGPSTQLRAKEAPKQTMTSVKTPLLSPGECRRKSGKTKCAQGGFKEEHGAHPSASSRRAATIVSAGGVQELLVPSSGITC